MPVTRDQAEQIAALAADMRPTGARRWDHPGIVHAIQRVAHLALADVAMATFRAATDRTLNTPAPIGDTRSSAWRERLTETVATKATVCPTHAVQHRAGICPSCRADELAHEPDKTGRPGQKLAPSAVAAIVGELRDIAHTPQENPR